MAAGMLLQTRKSAPSEGAGPGRWTWPSERSARQLGCAPVVDSCQAIQFERHVPTMNRLILGVPAGPSSCR